MPRPWPQPLFDYVQHGAFLNNIQGNILKAHGRQNACLVFWRCDWTGARPEGFWSEVYAKITSGAQQKNQALLARSVKFAAGRANDVFRSFALTAKGMFALAVNDPKDPNDPNASDEALRNDPQVENPFITFNCAPNPAANLPADTPDWAKEEVHGVWQVGCDDLNQLTAVEIPALIELGSRFGLTTTGTEMLIRWQDDREPFGFKDGISIARFFEDEADPTEPKLGGTWATMPLEQVLIAPGVSLNDAHEGGAQLVLVKFEQDVAAFRKFEEDSGIPELGSLLIGRTRDGEPLAQLKQAGQGEHPLNCFDFEKDPVAKGQGKPAMRCPFHAHIRKMNTRTAARNGPDGLPSGEMLRAQLVRRGMVFDPEGLLTTVAPWPSGGVGLMFMAYAAFQHSGIRSLEFT